MGGSLRTIGSAVAGIVLAAGCSSSPWSASRQPDPRTGPPPVHEPALHAPGTPGSGSDAQTMQQVMAELQQLGAFNPAGQEKLMADLRQTDPDLWPLVLQQFRAAAAYRRRAEQGETAIAGWNHHPRRGPPARPPDQPVPPGAHLPQHAPQSPGQFSPGVGRLPVTNDAAVAPVHAPEGNYPSTQYPPVGAPPANRPPAGQQVPETPGRVISASYDPTVPGDWQAHLAGAIRALESQLQDTPRTPGEIAQHARLRMLYLLSGRRDEAVRPIPSIAPAAQEFWSKELFGLATWLDTQRMPDATDRAAETKRILGEAITRLGESAPLVVRNLAFCTKVQSYGCVEPFKRYEFAPDQKVLLYAEVENFTAESTAKGFHTALRSSYQIFDSRNQRVADHSFPVTEEYCQNPRRDYFIGYHLRTPKRIYPGKHILKLTLEDLKSRKIGQSSIEFTIKEIDE